MNKTPDSGAAPQRLGRGMIVAAWLLLLALLTWFFNESLNRQHNPNQLVMTAMSADGQPEVRLKRNRFGHYVATGQINSQPVVFMLDTGATDVSVPLPVAEKLGLEKGQPVQYRTANGTIRAWQTVIDEIRLGDLGIGPVRASINPGTQGDEILLGMSFLKHLDFKQQGDTLTLRPPARH
ncbi:MAG: TIGR02281 family clan AA aspartic protease [Gammaproteobacteria bacterium]|nr:MAG: TIGR02281 family clan AA aspartic protease [Gammaproteobacteria bacterium]